MLVEIGAPGGGAGGSNPADNIDSQVPAFSSDFATLIYVIRSRAGAARMVALNVPNLAALPLFADASLAQRQATQRASAGMAAAVK